MRSQKRKPGNPRHAWVDYLMRYGLSMSAARKRGHKFYFQMMQCKSEEARILMTSPIFDNDEYDMTHLEVQ